MNEFKTIAEHAAKEGWIKPAATVTTPNRKYVRREPVARTSRAKLGMVMRDGRKYVIEYLPKAGLVVRQFYRQTRHTLSLDELVDIAMGQTLAIKFDDRGLPENRGAQ